jgi:hypothetical protein
LALILVSPFSWLSRTQCTRERQLNTQVDILVCPDCTALLHCADAAPVVGVVSGHLVHFSQKSLSHSAQLQDPSAQ